MLTLAKDGLLANLDGYPYALIDPFQRDWPRVAQGNDIPPQDWTHNRWSHCDLVRTQCFPKGKTASQIFRHIAFEEPRKCGDCRA